MDQPEIDGVLVGGASLEPASFARLVNYRWFVYIFSRSLAQPGNAYSETLSDVSFLS
jgi:hypothetical protein